MGEAKFLVRSKKEYESELGPKLILIAEKPLPTDRVEIFDSPKAHDYLIEVFHSKFKAAETHITFVKNEKEEIPFTRNMFFNILAYYTKKGTLEPDKLAIAFVGQAAFDAFKYEYNNGIDANGYYIYLNEEQNVIKLDILWLNRLVKTGDGKAASNIVLPYVILPDLDYPKEVTDSLNKIDFDKKIITSPYCDTSKILDKLNFILSGYKNGYISYFLFSAKVNFISKKIEYFKIYDNYTKMSLLYCPTDDICKDDSKETKQHLYKVLKEVFCTVPVTGENIENTIQVFNFSNDIKIATKEDLSLDNSIPTKKFEVTGNPNGSERSEWYHKWYTQVFVPELSSTLRNKQVEKEGYGKAKYEWIYDIEVFKEDWLLVAKTLDGKNKLMCWNDSDKLRDWLRNKIMIGFNNAAYDDVVIRHAISYPFFTDLSNTVKKYSDALILHGAKPAYPVLVPGSPDIPNFLSWDISFHGPFDIRRNSLKKLTMAVLNRRNYDSSVSFDINRKLTPRERLDVEKYCEMDVDNTLALFLQDPDNPKRTFAQESYDIRWNMIIEYKMRAKTLINKSSSFAGKLLCGEDAKPNTRNTYKVVNGKKQYYAIPELALKELAGTKLLQFYLDNQDNPDYITEKFELYLGDIEDESHKCQFGFGGLHQALIGYRSKNLVNMDVASLYPSLLVEYNLMSRGASKNPESYKDVYHTRLAAKKEGKTLLNLGLKLILNGAIGAMLSEYNPLFDTWSNSSICVHGQLFLYILTMRLYRAGFNIIQINTDGIMIERQEDVDFMPIAEQWMKETRLVLEFDEIDTLAQNNVNNYYCKFSNGKVKSKGFYLSNEKFGKATSIILCNMVTDQPLFEGISPRDYVIFKKHGVGEIYDGITHQKVDGRSLAFVAGYETDPNAQSYYSRSKNARKVVKKDINGKPILDKEGNSVTEEVHTESKITGFTEHMVLIDDLNELKMDEINTAQYVAFARNLLDDKTSEFGPYFNADYQKVEEADIYQALNVFKDNTVENPKNNNVYAQNLLFECDDLSKEDQEAIIERNKDILYRVVWSGSKSYHCIIRLSKPVTYTQYKNIWLYLRYKYKWAGADIQSGIPSKYTRVPNMINPKTGEQSTLYSYDKNILDVDEILDELPRVKDKVKEPKEYTGEISVKALQKHINKLDWTEGNRYLSCQRLSGHLVGLVTLDELLKMIPDGESLNKDHLYVIRAKYRYYERCKKETKTDLDG